MTNFMINFSISQNCVLPAPVPRACARGQYISIHIGSSTLKVYQLQLCLQLKPIFRIYPIKISFKKCLHNKNQKVSEKLVIKVFVWPMHWRKCSIKKEYHTLKKLYQSMRRLTRERRLSKEEFSECLDTLHKSHMVTFL